MKDTKSSVVILSSTVVAWDAEAAGEAIAVQGRSQLWTSLSIEGR